MKAAKKSIAVKRTGSPGRATAGVAVLWASGPVAGRVEVHRGRLAGLMLSAGRAAVASGAFRSRGDGPVRLEARVSGAVTAPGPHSTLVTVRTENNAFTFFLRDVSSDTPIYVPEYRVAVTAAADARGYREIAESVRARGLVSPLQRIEGEPEETYESACLANRDQMCPTWLGLGRDMRIFRVGYSPERGYWGYVEPCYHSRRPCPPADEDRRRTPIPPKNRPHTIGFCIGRGAACQVRITRRLEQGVLPILTSVQEDGDVRYHLTAFATLEKGPLSAGAPNRHSSPLGPPARVRGSQWQAAYANTGGNMLTEPEIERLRGLIEREMFGREEETVCCIRIEAVNSGAVPRYAWFKTLDGQWQTEPVGREFRGKDGFSEADGRVYGISRLADRPMPQPEMAVLLAPGRSVTVDLIVPHQPLPRERAKALARLDVAAHLDACRAFWREKLASAAQISVPEAAVDERIRAGLLHCDLVALGREPAGSVLATIGWYAPIGSESSPIIQFFDSMGWHKLARRSIQFFLDRQRDDGFIQNFGGYQLETGGVLWTMGEHFRYTRDRKWLGRVLPNVLKACAYLLKWRDRNKRNDLRGRGYGLQDGKVADPEDFFHSFMLNGLSYIGIARAAEMLGEVDPAYSRRLAREAAAYREDIRIAFREAMARSPVIPTGDGTWAPTAPPWAGHRGPLVLYAEGGQWWTHGAFGARDSLIGALHLVLCEVLDPAEVETGFLLRSHQELFTVRNAGLSQPYYCRHDYAHLLRGEVKAFLKTYYNQFTALQDRQTYTFWEHYYHASQHKTHEEGWFLMQTRWMLWHEEGETLCFLRAVPRRWLQDGRQIVLRNVATYFGPASLTVRSRLADGVLEAAVVCRGKRRPSAVSIRLPHPDGRRAVSAEGGDYCAGTETVHVRRFTGRATVALRF